MFIGAIVGLVIFSMSDNAILGLFQKLSDKATRRTGKDNYELATMIAWMGATAYALALLVRSMAKWGRALSPELQVLPFAGGFILFGWCLYFIKKGRKIYHQEDNAIQENWSAKLDLEGNRLMLYFFLFGWVAFDMFGRGGLPVWINIAVCGPTLTVAYLASCRPLPTAKEKVSALKWILEKIRGAIVPLRPVPAPTRD